MADNIPMTYLECNTRTRRRSCTPSSEAVKNAWLEAGVHGMTVAKVGGHSRQKGHTKVCRGSGYVVDDPPQGQS